MRSFSELNLNQKISLIGLLITTTASVGLYYLSASAYAYYSLVIGTTVIVITDRIVRYEFERKTERQLQLYSFAEADLHWIGSGAEGVDWFCNNSRDLTLVRNTVFSRNDVDKYPLVTLKVQQLEAEILKVLDNNCRWIDVFTSDQTQVVNAFRKKLSPKQSEKYICRKVELDPVFPLLQSVLLTYKDGSKSVLFGWGFLGGNEDDSKVFYCNHRDTVRYFSSYFDELEKKATTVTSAP